MILIVMVRRKERIPLADGDEQDYFSGWRRVLSVFYNNTGLGKKMKRKYNKRARKEAKSELQERGRA
jgi:hypothetical protein